MSKKGSAGKNKRQARHQAPVSDPRQQGLRAFRSGRLDQAISLWSELASDDAEVTAALAEAYARRARSRAAGSDPIADLRRAVALAPSEPVYQYHLALALHRAGDLPGAINNYRAVLAHDPAWPGADTVLALVLIEQDAKTDLNTVPDISPAARAALAPVRAVLNREVPTHTDDTPAARLWKGLALVGAGSAEALAILDDPRPLPAAEATTIRRLYKGVAAARLGDLSTALNDWERAYHEEERSRTPRRRQWLLDNLASALTQRLGAQLDSGDLRGATATAQRALKLPAVGNPALGAILVQTLDRAAHSAAADGDWSLAAELWEGARKVVGSTTGLGSPQPLLRNLALAYEAQEEWTGAAEAWRAMLRTRPRTGTDGAEGSPAASQWAWVRKRVIECYKRAGQPGEAVTVFRQIIKADPSDLDSRLQLAEALFANEQEQAAMNELYRILDLDPNHADARLLLARLHQERGEWWAAESALRKVLEQQPERADVRKQLIHLILERGQDLHNRDLRAAARKAFQEGQELAPDDYRFPLNLARIAIDERKLNQAQELLDRTLKLGTDETDAYIQVLHCWSVADKMDEVRAVLARAEAAGKATSDLYLAVGALLIDKAAESMPLIASFGLPTAAPKRKDDPWSRLGEEMLDRAIALEPDDPGVRFLIAAKLMISNTDLAIQYAQAGLQMAPDNVRGMTLLALLQAVNDDTREAKKTLQRAARLAREQGDPDLIKHVEETRSLVNTPMLRMMLQMGPMLDLLGDEDLDIDADDLF